MKTEHKYAQVLRWIADGAQIEWFGWGGVWHPITTEALLKALSGEEPAPPNDFRLKPRTITVNGREIVAGAEVDPERGITYYLPVPHQERMYGWETWTNNDFDRRTFSRGLVHLTKENAIAHAKAMLGID